jgi:2-C-methyl-D-erythritol 4-phosphate cytidylyltransferase
VISPAASLPDVGVVVVAAGAGVRAGPGEPKQFRPIDGVPMLLRALRPFAAHPQVDRVALVLPGGYVMHPPDWLTPLMGERLRLVAGGVTRADSVMAGLAALPPETRIVLVHDAARPFVARSTIDAVIARARTGVGAVAAVPMGDTVKDVDDDGRVAHTVPRARLWRAQTPQGFPLPMLAAAYAPVVEARGGSSPTDDAELCERAGMVVEVVTDSPGNLKVTTAEDFRIADALARALR